MKIRATIPGPPHATPKSAELRAFRGNTAADQVGSVDMQLMLFPEGSRCNLHFLAGCRHLCSVLWHCFETLIWDNFLYKASGSGSGGDSGSLSLLLSCPSLASSKLWAWWVRGQLWTPKFSLGRFSEVLTVPQQNHQTLQVSHLNQQLLNLLRGSKT